MHNEDTARQVLRRVLAVWKCLAAAEEEEQLEAEIQSANLNLVAGESREDSQLPHPIRHEAVQESGAAK